MFPGNDLTVNVFLRDRTGKVGICPAGKDLFMTCQYLLDTFPRIICPGFAKIDQYFRWVKRIIHKGSSL
jgi:hypothetical protein